MHTYKAEKNETGVDAWPPLTETFDIKILEGTPAQSGRVDFGSLEGPIVGGVWECTPGKFEFNYTADEMATVLDGEVRITDASGTTNTYGPGDTFHIAKGEKTNWEVVRPLRKCFFIYTG
jgi:uncharacterized cupin superfamily protein